MICVVDNHKRAVRKARPETLRAFSSVMDADCALRLVSREHATFFQDQRAHRLIGPEDISLRVVLFVQEPISESGTLVLFRVVYGVYLHARFLLVTLEN